jgi:hypothetical protein
LGTIVISVQKGRMVYVVHITKLQKIYLVAGCSSHHQATAQHWSVDHRHHQFGAARLSSPDSFLGRSTQLEVS